MYGMNVSKYTVAYTNDYDRNFTISFTVDYPTVPWEVRDEFETLREFATERAGDARVSLSDYTLSSISFGGMEIASYP